MERLTALKIPINTIHNQYDIKKALTFWTTDYLTDEKTKHEFFFEIEGHLFVPRYFNHELGISDKLVNDLTIKGKDIAIEDKITLRNEAQEKAYQFLLNSRSGILKLPPGRGKTVITIKYLSTMKKKFLVFVDTEKLLSQWIERITQFTDLTEDDIGIIRADKYELDKKCAIAMTQTIVSKTKKESIRKILNDFKDAGFGITIYDEVHTLIGPQFFTNICMVVPSYYTFGLSATPYRTDDRTKLLYYWLSNNMFVDNEYEMTPKVILYFYNSTISTSKTWRWICYGGQFNRMRYQKKLSENEEFLNAVKSILIQSKENNRNVVLISEIKKVLDDIIIQNESELGSDNIGFFVGGSDESEKYKKYVFTTYKLCNKGIDNDKWDTLVLLTPISSPVMLEQTVGRIVRSRSGKSQPVVIDMIDLTYPSVFISMLSKRLNFYREMGFDIDTLNDNLLDMLQESYANKIREQLKLIK